MRNLEIRLKEKERERDNILDMWAKDVAALSNTKNFDELSKKGARDLKRIANKYADSLIEIEDEINVLKNDLDFK